MKTDKDNPMVASNPQAQIGEKVMSAPAQQSIKAKLMSVSRVISSFGLLLALSIFTVFQYYSMQEDMIQELEVLGGMVSDNSQAALAFDGREDAQEILLALHHQPEVLAGAIYTLEGEVFASYQQQGQRLFTFSGFQPDGIYFEGNVLHLYRTIVFQGENLGMVSLHRNLWPFYYQLGRNILAGLLILMATLGLAYGMASRLHQQIINPLLILAQTTERISTTGNLSFTKHQSEYREIQTIYDGVYRMLWSIQGREQERDAALSTVRDNAAMTRALVETAPDAIITISWEGTIESINPAAEGIFGYMAKDIIGQTLRVLIPPHTDIPETQYAQWLLQAADAVPINMEEGIIGVRSNGIHFPIDLSVSEIQLREQRKLTIILRDITERKQSEMAIKDLNENLEAKVVQRTEELHQIQQEMVAHARQAGMAEIAIGILHNIGNVLNSANISTGLVMTRLKGFDIESLVEAANLLNKHRDDLATFFSTDPRGALLVNFLQELASQLQRDQKGLVEEMLTVRKHLEHIQQIVATQQKHAKRGGVQELIDLPELMTDVLRITIHTDRKYPIRVIANFSIVENITTDRHVLMQILTNVLSNARYALQSCKQADPTLTITFGMLDDTYVRIAITDNGVGIDPEHLTRIFEYGFTTKHDGNGFGLHSAVLSAKELGGSLKASSAGYHAGATFVLLLPLAPTNEGQQPKGTALPMEDIATTDACHLSD